MGEISRPPVKSFLERQTVSATVEGSVTSLSGEVTNDDESNNKNYQANATVYCC